MPLELGIWRIDKELRSVPASGLDLEERLESLLDQDVTIANPGWMVIGRQVDTGFGGRVDLLAIDAVGNLILLELKRDQTPREVIAQVLEYGAWVNKLKAFDLSPIFRKYIERFHPERGQESLDQAFCKRFSVRELPEDLNQDHELVVVASQFDAASERVVEYLSDTHEVAINAIFFRVFKDGDREYLARVWLRDPTQVDLEAESKARGEWNGEYYVSFGGRDWEQARAYGFISGGGGAFYSRTLSMLSPGDRIWVNVPGTGYVGVGEVIGSAEHLDDIRVPTVDGLIRPLNEIEGLQIAQQAHAHDRGELGEIVVPVKWIHTVASEKAVKERGLFGNQNTVARPRADAWRHTVERLKKLWGVR